MKWVRELVMLVLTCAGGCATRPALPPPTYQEPTLPPWEAPPPAADPLDATFADGEWVSEPSVESGEPVDQGTDQDTGESEPGENSQTLDPPQLSDGNVADPSPVESPQ